jgi:hypothetical protein
MVNMMKNQLWGNGTQTLRSERLFNRQKRKVYYVDLKQNHDGRFVKITEACGGKRDSIVIPDSMADALIGAVIKVKGGAR